MIKICPRCNRRIIVEDNTLDFEHDCNSGITAIDQESVVKTGKWEDYTGSGDVSNPMMQGMANKFFGTRAGIDGERLGPLTARGESAQTHRVRAHKEFIVLKNEKGGEDK